MEGLDLIIWTILFVLGGFLGYIVRFEQEQKTKRDEEG